MAMTNEEIRALLPTISDRPQIYYDLVRTLVAEGFTHDHRTAEWVKEMPYPEPNVRGRICFTEEGDKAWLKHPVQHGGGTSHHLGD